MLLVMQVQVFERLSADSWTGVWRRPADEVRFPPRWRFSAARRSATSHLYLRCRTVRCVWTTTGPCYSSERRRETWRTDRSGSLKNTQQIHLWTLSSKQKSKQIKHSNTKSPMFTFFLKKKFRYISEVVWLFVKSSGSKQTYFLCSDMKA